MTAATAVVLGIAVLAAWLGAAAFVRLRTPLERLHVVTFVNVAVGGAVVVAALLADGVTARTLQIVAIWLIATVGGALLSHVTARALHLRQGERQ